MKTIKDVKIKNKTVLIRCDFNVPIKDGIITDDTRIKKTLKTIEYCLSQNARIILMSHLGKVKQASDLNQTLAPVAAHLSSLLNCDVSLVQNITNPNLKEVVDRIPRENIVLLENTRFADYPNQLESNCELALAALWASLAEIFVFDAFGAAHRNHASTGGIIEFLPTVIGFLVEAELNALKGLERPKRPFIAVMGGAKIDDKIKLINKLLTNVDKLIVGGGIALPFVKALGMNINYDNEANVALCRDLLINNKNKIILPLSLLVVENEEYQDVPIDQLTLNMNVVDISDSTAEFFKNQMINAKTIIYNGPMGIIEKPESAKGTLSLLYDLSKFKNKKIIIGGGDTGVLIHQFGMDDRFYHVSTGGGATLTYLEQGSLPVLDIIKQNKVKI